MTSGSAVAMAGTVVEVALNGGVPVSANPNVPRTPGEITRDAIRCIEVGASMVHNHNDEAVTSGPAEHDWRPYVEAWTPVLEAHPDVLLYPTMPGWRPETTIEQRYSHVEKLAELGILGTPVIDLGGFNIGRAAPGGWPEPTDEMYLNTYRDMDYMFRRCQSFGRPISLAVFEPGHLRAGLAYHSAGAVPPGSMFKIFFDSSPMGRPGRGLPPTPAGLAAYVDMMADFDVPWMAVVNGRADLATDFFTDVLERGGHVSVGIERAGAVGEPRNADLVAAAVALCDSVGRPALSCGQTKALLGQPS